MSDSASLHVGVHISSDLICMPQRVSGCISFAYVGLSDLDMMCTAVCE